MTQKQTIIIDVLIGFLMVAVIILVDHLWINYRSRSADEDWSKVKIEESASLSESAEFKTEFYQIKNGERVFLPILNFHHIGTAPVKADAVTRSFYIEPQKFETIIKSLVNDGYLIIFVSEAVNYLQQKKIPQGKIMAITFDDGNEDFYTLAWPILKKYNLKSSMFLMTGVRGNDWLTIDQVLELNSTGLVEFGSHTVWHPKLTKISESEQDRELIDSREFLEKLLNKKIDILAYPFGLYNEEIKNRTELAGYAAGLTFDQDAWQDPDDLMTLTRISVYPELNVIKFLEKLKTEK